MQFLVEIFPILFGFSKFNIIFAPDFCIKSGEMPTNRPNDIVGSGGKTM